MTMFSIGDRVELMPRLDLWMRGARYGTVVAINKPMYQGRHGAALLMPVVSVRMDHPQVKRPIKVFVTDLQPAG